MEHVSNKVCTFIVSADKESILTFQANHTKIIDFKNVRIGTDLLNTYVSTDSWLIASTSRVLANRFRALGFGV